MTREANSENRPRMIMRACLNYVRPIALQGRCRLLGRSNDRDVSRFVRIRVRKDYYNQIASVGLGLRGFGAGHGTPALTRAFIARKPFRLGIRQQQLTVFGRAQNVNAQLLGGCGGKRTAVSVLSGSFILRASSAPPVSQFTC